VSAEQPPAVRSQPSSPLQFGSWSLGVVPLGWEAVPGHGIRDASEGAFPSSVVVGEDTLPSPTTLEQYIKAQLVIVETYLPEARHSEIRTQESGDADEAASLEIELPAPDGGTGVMRQLYARFDAQVGVVTFTTLASELSRLEPIFESIRANLTFRGEQSFPESTDNGGNLHAPET
jgi:hypothetical protein